jgi:undecaprenyl pyrophosphate phosphatase UppP
MLRRWVVEETTRGFLWAAGIIIAIILATITLKKFFNMATSGALCCVLVGIGILGVIILLGIEYSAYKKREGRITTNAD